MYPIWCAVLAFQSHVSKSKPRPAIPAPEYAIFWPTDPDKSTARRFWYRNSYHLSDMSRQGIVYQRKNTTHM